jgi:hypothetical protein
MNSKYIAINFTSKKADWDENINDNKTRKEEIIFRFRCNGNKSKAQKCEKTKACIQAGRREISQSEV